jgi:hypothetical protein
MSQDPVAGGFAYHFRRSIEDTLNHHTYDTVEAALRMIDVARIGKTVSERSKD